MLMMDFIGTNFPSALFALQQWSSYLQDAKEHEALIGLSMWNSRSQPLPRCPNLTVREVGRVIREYCQGLPVVYWDSDVEKAVEAHLRREGIRSKPSFSSFSYGSIINRGLLLANEMNADYLVRVDPGTCPHPQTTRPTGETVKYDWSTILKEHVSAIGNTNAVVSLSYSGRLSVRNDFLKPEEDEKQCKLVATFTGIDPRQQVTGGALFTSKVPGIPAIPFEPSKRGPTLVWGSDDGRYQLLDETRGSRNLNTHRQEPIFVPRFEAVGKPKTTIEYYRGLAGAVYLQALKESPDKAKASVEEFLNQLRDELLDHNKCQIHDKKTTVSEWVKSFVPNTVAPGEFLDKIADGLKGYITLREDWRQITSLLKGKLLSLIQIV